MTIHLRLEVKDDIEALDAVEETDSDTVDTQTPDNIPPPIVVELVESMTLGRGEDEVLAQPISDPDSDAEFNRQMEMLKNIHVDLADFHAHHRGVSRKHARVTYRNQRLSVADLGSTNGTYVNNERLDPNVEYPIKEGDELRLGFMTLVITII